MLLFLPFPQISSFSLIQVGKYTLPNVKQACEKNKQFFFDKNTKEYFITDVCPLILKCLSESVLWNRLNRTYTNLRHNSTIIVNKKLSHVFLCCSYYIVVVLLNLLFASMFAKNLDHSFVVNIFFACLHFNAGLNIYSNTLTT